MHFLRLVDTDIVNEATTSKQEEYYDDDQDDYG